MIKVLFSSLFSGAKLSDDLVWAQVTDRRKFLRRAGLKDRTPAEAEGLQVKWWFVLYNYQVEQVANSMYIDFFEHSVSTSILNRIL